MSNGVGCIRCQMFRGSTWTDVWREATSDTSIASLSASYVVVHGNPCGGERWKIGSDGFTLSDRYSSVR
jgi:hypothetical protein